MRNVFYVKDIYNKVSISKVLPENKFWWKFPDFYIKFPDFLNFIKIPWLFPDFSNFPDFFPDAGNPGYVITNELII